MRRTASALCDLLDDGFRFILTHGNGPQVGNILRRVEIASDELYTIPLEVCVADTQAGMGYMMAQCLMNEMVSRGRAELVTTLVTTVEVDSSDAAFQSPSKPIGPRMRRAEAEHHKQRDGWAMREVAVGQFRRIVPSPLPQRILELENIHGLASDGSLVVCCGGGGIPVVRDASGQYQGAAAVIDKDRTTALLARQLGVRTLVILTDVDHVYLHYGQSNQRPLETIHVQEVIGLLELGNFDAGSMLPKMAAAAEFVDASQHPDATAVITNLENTRHATAGEIGTRVVK